MPTFNIVLAMVGALTLCPPYGASECLIPDLFHELGDVAGPQLGMRHGQVTKRRRRARLHDGAALLHLRNPRFQDLHRKIKRLIKTPDAAKAVV